jgi:transposase InsO family protein
MPGLQDESSDDSDSDESDPEMPGLQDESSEEESSEEESESDDTGDEMDQPSQVLVPCSVANIQAFALLDSGADLSAINTEFAKKHHLKVQHRDGKAKSAEAVDGTLLVLDKYVVAELKIGDKQILHEFEVLKLTDGDLLLGYNLWPHFGLGISGLPAKFPTNQSDAKVTLDGPFDYDLTATDGEGSSASAYTDKLWQESDRIGQHELDSLMAALADVLKENESLPSSSHCTHPAAIVTLDTGDAPPVYRRQYPVADKLIPVLNDQVDTWIKEGIIEPAPAGTSWNFSLLVVPKKDLSGKLTKYRVCIDPRPLNEHIQHEEKSVPVIQELFKKLAGFAYATALDLKYSYHQFPITKADRPKTTFTWNSRRWMFTGAPFGIKHLTSVFQSAMEIILEDCAVFVLIYVDDIIIFSDTLEDHIEHVREVISTLTKHNLRLQLPKCEFGYSRLTVLGHVLSGQDRRMDPVKLTTLGTLPVPTTGKMVMSFLGFVNYLRDYVPMYSALAAPLEKLRSLKKITPDRWTQECQDAFTAFTSILSAAPVLEFPKPGINYIVAVDASQHGIAAVLYQTYDDSDHYISFVSKSLNKSQLNYPATRRELLAIVFALQRLRPYLYGTHFELRTDHKALTYLFTQRHVNYMILNWLDVLLDYSFTIVHCPGILNILPDALSRCYPPAVWGGSNVTVSSQNSDKKQTAKINTISLNDLTTYPERKLVELVNERLDKHTPKPEEQAKLLNQYHCMGHMGGLALYKTLWDFGYYWPFMRAKCLEHVSKCPECTRFNIGKTGFHPMKTISATNPMDHVVMDLATFKKTTPRGNNYVMVVVDVGTRYTFLRALRDKFATTIAIALWMIFCEFGFPKILQSDNGSEFANAIIMAFASLIGIDQRFVAPYNPRANGLAEVSVKVMKQMLYKMIAGNTANFDLFLPSVQFAMNTRILSIHKSQPMSLMFARPTNPLIDYTNVEAKLLTPQQLEVRNDQMVNLIYPELRKAADEHRSTMARRANKKRPISKPLKIDSWVMLQDAKAAKGEGKWVGPYRVVRRTLANTYALMDSHGKLLSRNRARSMLKPIAPPDDSHNKPAFYIEEILDHRKIHGQDQFLVKWYGYPSSENSWEPLGSFEDRACIKKFWQKRDQK